MNRCRAAPWRPAVGRALCLAASLLAGHAQAGDEVPLWQLGLGVGVLHLPDYRGADQARNWLLPVPYFVYHGPVLKADRDGARASLWEAWRTELNLSLGAGAPTSSKDNRAREGMPDLAPTIELGPTLNHQLWREAGWRLDLRLPLRAAVTIESRPHLAGWIFQPQLALDRRSGDWNLGLSSGPLFGDRKLNAYYYEVAANAATPGRPAYRASGGYAGWQLIAAASRRLDTTWLGLFVKADSLHGAVFEDSPLVRQRGQWSAGFAMAWVLAESGERVRLPD